MFRKLTIMRRWLFKHLLQVVILLSLLCIAATGGIEEPWNTLLFLIVIPILIQLYKIYRDNGGKPLSKLALQVISFILSFAFVFLSGGFLLDWPTFPTWAGELVPFIGLIVVWTGKVIVTVDLAFGALQSLYELVYKRLYETIGFAAAADVARRKANGFWA